MELTIRMDFKLPIKVVKGEKHFVASCPAIDVVSQGKTQKKAKENLGEALSAFFISCIERGVLDAVLKNCGFKSVKKISSVKKPVLKNQEYINIPLHLLSKQVEANRCHV